MTPEQRKDLERFSVPDGGLVCSAAAAALAEIDALKARVKELEARLAGTECTDCEEAEQRRAARVKELEEEIRDWQATVDDVLGLRDVADAKLAAVIEDCDCICGCPEHESYGEDGWSCAQEDHECVLAPHSVGVMLRDSRAKLAAVKALHYTISVPLAKSIGLIVNEDICAVCACLVPCPTLQAAEGRP